MCRSAALSLTRPSLKAVLADWVEPSLCNFARSMHASIAAIQHGPFDQLVDLHWPKSVCRCAVATTG